MATKNAIGSNIPIEVSKGGTNASSFATTDGTVYFDGTRLVTTATGSSGNVLTSGGPGVAPAYAAPAASSISITGNTGGALTGASFTFVTANSTVKFAGSVSTETVDFGQNNLILGGGTIPSVSSGNANVGVGAGTTLNAISSGQVNTAIGFGSMTSCNTGQQNTAVGYNPLKDNISGNNNVAIGHGALYNNSTGSNNTAIGYDALSGNFSGSLILGKDAVATANNQCVFGSSGVNAGSVATESNLSTKVWNVIINGVAQKILLA